jgi:hypothetical protein
LLSAEKKVGPKTADALQTALSGGLLSDQQISYLRGALEKDPNLSPKEKAAIASALQNDQDEKRRLQTVPGSGGIAPVVGLVQPVVVPGPVVVTGSPGIEQAVQTERFLSVKNDTGDVLTVYVRYPGDEQQTWKWTFQPDELSYLAIENERITASQVYIWAESGMSRWDRYKDELFNVVPEPYRADAIATHTHTFRR